MPADYNSKNQWVQQPSALLDQAAPNINQWYVILAPTGRQTRILAAICRVLVAGETLELEFTVDGNIFLGTVAAVAGTLYAPWWQSSTVDNLSMAPAAVTIPPFAIEGGNAGVRIRKTTAAGAGNIDARVVYALD